MRDFLVNNLLVTIKREVVTLGGDVGLGDAEGLGGAGAVEFLVSGGGVGALEMGPAGEEVGEVVFRVVAVGEGDAGDGAEFFRGEEFGAFVVEGEAVGIDIVEPDVVGAAGVGPGEEEDVGGDAGVGLEDAAGEGDDGVELLLLDELLAEGLVGLRRAEEDAIGDDDGGAAAGLQQAKEEGEEEELGLPGLDDLEEVLGGILVVEGAGEGRIGEDEGVFFLLTGVILGEGVAVSDGGIFHAVEEHIHAADAEHGAIEIEAVEGLLVEVALEGGVVEEAGVAVAEVLPGGDEEAGGAAGGVADDIARLGSSELDHEADDVAGGAELAILPGGGDLPEHVLVEVALRIAVLHGDLPEEVHDLREEGGGGDGEAGIPHVAGVGGAIAAEGAEEGEDVLADDLVHLLGLEVLEAGPAEVEIGAALGVEGLGEDLALEGLAEAGGLVLLEGLEVIEALEEEEVGDLLDDLEGIGDAAGPEGVPDGVDFAADGGGEHGEKG